MSAENNIDKLFREKLLSQEIPMPANGLDKMDAILDGQGRGKKWGFFLFSLCVLISTATWLYFEYTQPGTATASVASEYVVTVTSPFNNQMQSEKTTTELKSEKPISSSPDDPGKASGEEIYASGVIEKHNEAITTHEINGIATQKSDRVKEIKKDAGNTYPLSKEKNTSTDDGAAHLNDAPNTGKNEKEVASATMPTALTQRNFPDERNQGTDSQHENGASVKSIDGKEMSHGDQGNNKERQLRSNVSNNVLQETKPTPQTSLNKLAYRNFLLPVSKAGLTAVHFPTPQPKQDNKTQSKFGVQLTPYLLNTYSTFRAQGDIPEGYITRRNAEEKSANDLAFEINGYKETGRFRYGIGIGYQMLSENIQYSPAALSNSIVDNGSWSYEDSTGILDIDTVPVGGIIIYDTTFYTYHVDSTYLAMFDTTREYISEQSISARNGRSSWQCVSIPLSASILLTNHFLKGKLYLNVGWSGIYAIKRTSWYMKTDESALEEISSIDTYRSFNMMGSLGIEYDADLTRRSYLIIQTVYRRNLMSWNQDFSHHYGQFGLRIGIGLRLDR